MGLGSVLVVVAVLALAVFAVWRNLRKGVPCECGGECRACGGARPLQREKFLKKDSERNGGAI